MKEKKQKQWFSFYFLVLKLKSIISRETTKTVISYVLVATTMRNHGSIRVFELAAHVLKRSMFYMVRVKAGE